MSSSDTSSDEDIDRFKEALDPTFLKDDIYSKNGKSKTVGKKQPPPSLRPKNNENIAFNPMMIKVTPEFQKHVSNHLTMLLDGLIDDSEKIHVKKRKKLSDEKGGVRLLHGSKDYLCEDSSTKPVHFVKKMKRKKRKIDGEGDTDSSEEEKRVKEVAVTPEQVLSQEDTKHWAPNMKGTVEVIQSQNSIISPVNGISKAKKKRKKNKLKTKLM